MFDHLVVDDDIDDAVFEWKVRKISVQHLHPRIARPHVCDRRLVVVQTDDPTRHARDQVGAVALATTGLEHVPPGAAGGQPFVDHLMAAEPVVLLRQPGDRAFPGER